MIYSDSLNYSVTVEEDEQNIKIDKKLFQIIIITIFIFLHSFYKKEKANFILIDINYNIILLLLTNYYYLVFSIFIREL